MQIGSRHATVERVLCLPERQGANRGAGRMSLDQIFKGLRCRRHHVPGPEVVEKDIDQTGLGRVEPAFLHIVGVCRHRRPPATFGQQPPRRPRHALAPLPGDRIGRDVRAVHKRAVLEMGRLPARDLAEDGLHGVR